MSMDLENILSLDPFSRRGIEALNRANLNNIEEITHLK